MKHKFLLIFFLIHLLKFSKGKIASQNEDSNHIFNLEKENINLYEIEKQINSIKNKILNFKTQKNVKQYKITQLSKLLVVLIDKFNKKRISKSNREYDKIKNNSKQAIKSNFLELSVQETKNSPNVESSESPNLIKFELLTNKTANPENIGMRTFNQPNNLILKINRKMSNRENSKLFNSKNALKINNIKITETLEKSTSNNTYVDENFSALNNNRFSKNPQYIGYKKEQDCNLKWDYLLNGEDWECNCNCGLIQSPISIESDFNFFKLDQNVFIDFFYKNKAEMIVTNSKMEVFTYCGNLILPPHDNTYKCYKIMLNSPGEHIINGIQYEGELKFFYKIQDKEIYDEDTKDYVILSVLFKADGEITYNNPWLDLFNKNINKIKRSQEKNMKIQSKSKRTTNKVEKTTSENEATLVYNDRNTLPTISIDFKEEVSIPSLDYLFDEAKFEELKVASLYKPKDGTPMPTEVILGNALKEFQYNKKFPLNSFYIYNGSFSTPPCEENVTYIINAEPIKVNTEEIINISEFISKYMSINGLSRNTQPIGNRIVAKYEGSKTNDNSSKIRLIRQKDLQSKRKVSIDSSDLKDIIKNYRREGYGEENNLVKSQTNIKNDSTENIMLLEKISKISKDKENINIENFIQRVDELLDKSSIKIDEIELFSFK